MLVIGILQKNCRNTVGKLLGILLECCIILLGIILGMPEYSKEYSYPSCSRIALGKNGLNLFGRWELTPLALLYKISWFTPDGDSREKLQLLHKLLQKKIQFTPSISIFGVFLEYFWVFSAYLSILTVFLRDYSTKMQITLEKFTLEKCGFQWSTLTFQIRGAP